MAAFFNVRSAYIRLSLLFSASSSSMHRSSATVVLAYFDFQLKCLAWLMPCLRMVRRAQFPHRHLSRSRRFGLR